MAKNSIAAIIMGNFTLTMSSTYQPIFANGLPQACYALRIINNGASSPTNAFISYDGTNDNDYVFGNSYIVVPPIFGIQPNNFIAYFPKGMQIYAKGTSGAQILVAGYFQPQK